MHVGDLITSRTNARVKLLRASLSGKASRPGDLVGIEGVHLIGEAIKSSLPLEMVYLSKGSEGLLQLPALAGLTARQWAVLSNDVFESAVKTESPQGIAATLRIPEVPLQHSEQFPGVHLVIEDLQDPGNLGTLIRSAEAFGLKNIFVTPSTANPWNPKTLRASAGSVFRMPIFRFTLQETKAWLSMINAQIFAAVPHMEKAVPSHNATLLPPCALMIGNEGAGLSQEALDIADEYVRIPCVTESLNAAIAGSVLMYETSRQYRVDLFQRIIHRIKPTVLP